MMVHLSNYEEFNSRLWWLWLVMFFFLSLVWHLVNLGRHLYYISCNITIYITNISQYIGEICDASAFFILHVRIAVCRSCLCLMLRHFGSLSMSDTWLCLSRPMMICEPWFCHFWIQRWDTFRLAKWTSQ